MDHGQTIIDYGKLAEQYGSFLVAIGGVSITVLTLVLGMWNLKPDPETSGDREAVSNRSTLIKALVIATFASFVGAHLMAETTAFVAGHDKEIAAKQFVAVPDEEFGAKRFDAVPDRGFGARQFLLAGVNIFNAVTVVMFAVMVLATEYKKENERLPGLRKVSAGVFRAVVFCVLWWMGLSIFVRMPPPHRGWLVLPIVLIPIVTHVTCARRKTDAQAMEQLMTITFATVIVSTLVSLVSCSWAFYTPMGDAVTLRDAMFFVSSITFTSVSLLFVSVLMSDRTNSGWGLLR